ncbi:hypothetical protein Hanom_Chr16g01469861 [Helianthus anomalus]
MELKVISGHNQAGDLSIPPEKHKKMFNSLIKGLNHCRLVHALRENSVVYEDLIFGGSIEAVIQKKKIIVTEQVIREVLLFGDRETDPINYSSEDVLAVLPSLSYKGTYPPLLKTSVHLY